MMNKRNFLHASALAASLLALAASAQAQDFPPKSPCPWSWASLPAAPQMRPRA